MPHNRSGPRYRWGKSECAQCSLRHFKRRLCVNVHQHAMMGRWGQPQGQWRMPQECLSVT